MRHSLACRIRGLRVPGFITCLFASMVLAAPASAVDLPRDKDTLVNMIRSGIETSDYDTFEKLVFWKDAGKIKKRIVRFHINRGLGRPIKSISFEDYPADGLDAAEATGKLVKNMDVTNMVKVVYDEEPINESGKLPTSVFLVGKVRDAFRIGLVVRKPGADDDDD